MAEEVDYDEDMAEDPPAYTETEGTMAVAGDSGSGSSGKKKGKVKGRGHGSAHMNGEGKYEGRGGVFERMGRGGGRGPLECESCCAMLCCAMLRWAVVLCYDVLPYNK
jgi:hypothetical protein